MSIKKVFAVKDVKSGLFNAPFYLFSRGEAIRSFIDATSNAETMLAKWPEDFGLYELGEWNDETAKFTTYDQPYFCGAASDFMKKE